MTEMEKATKRLFGPGSLEVKNIGFTLGSNPNVSAEDIARQINLMLDKVEAGEFELVDE